MSDVFDFQGTLLELLCDVVDASSRQGKSLVVCDFPRDLRWAEEFEAKVRKFTVICSLFFFFKKMLSLSGDAVNILIMLLFLFFFYCFRYTKVLKIYYRVKVTYMNAAWIKAVSNTAPGFTDSASLFP